MWTKEMEEYVRIHYGVLMIKEIAARLGIKPKEVSNKIAEKGWKKQGIREYAVYDGDRHVMSGTIQECADAIGVSTNTIKFYTMDVYTKRKLETWNRGWLLGSRFRILAKRRTRLLRDNAMVGGENKCLKNLQKEKVITRL